MQCIGSLRSAHCSCPVTVSRGLEALTAPALVSRARPSCQIPVRKGFCGHSWTSATPASARHALQPLQAVKTEALIFDCDGVILLSEPLHRQAYNLAFQKFEVRPKGESEIADWSVKYYDMLSNTVGGGKPKMHYYFGKFGYPTSTLQPNIPESEEDKNSLVDKLQEYKTTAYQDLIASGKVPARPNVNRIHDEARELGLKVGVCSAATKSSALVVLQSLMGQERFKALDVCIAGDDVNKKKPDPSIYSLAAERLGLDPASCLCVEDSTIGLKAALGAGMRCIITYHEGSADQDFHGAEQIMSEFSDSVKLADLMTAERRSDDRPGRQDS